MNHKCSRNREYFLISCNTRASLTFISGIVFMDCWLILAVLCSVASETGVEGAVITSKLPMFIQVSVALLLKLSKDVLSMSLQICAKYTNLFFFFLSFWGLDLERAIRKTAWNFPRKGTSLYDDSLSCHFSSYSLFSGIFFDFETVQYTESWRITLAL